MTELPKDLGGRWPVIDNGVARDHRCLLLFFHLLHALYQVPWKSCCSLPASDPGYEAEKKKIERRFTGKTKLDWDQIVCYLNKLPEPDQESAMLTAFCLFKRWCEGSRAGRTVIAAEEARRALEAAEAATAGRDWPAVAWLLAIPVAGMPVTTTSPIMMVPAAATDSLVATTEDSATPARAARVPRADLEEVERQLATALERARQDGERAEAADQRLEEADRIRGGLRARMIELGARCQQAEEDRDAALAAADAADARALAAAARIAQVDERAREAEARRVETTTLLTLTEDRAVEAERLVEHLRQREAHLADRVALLEEQAAARPSAPTPSPATPSPDAEMPASREPARRRRPWLSRRPEAFVRRDSDEDYLAHAHEQASLTAQLEETDRLRRDLVDTVAHEFRAPLAGIRAVLTHARNGEADGGMLTDRLDTAIDNTRQLERLLESMVTATTAAHTDINASDLTAALADVQTVLRTIHTSHPVIVDAPAHLPVRMDGATLRQLLGDLTDTVLRATPAGVPVHIGAGQVGTDLIILRIRTPTRVIPDGTEASALAAPSVAGIRYVIEQVVSAHGGRLRTDTRYSDGVFDILEIELPAAGIPAVAPPDETAALHRLHDPITAPATATPART